MRSNDDESRSTSSSSSSSSVISLPMLDAETQSAQIINVADHSNEITYSNGVPKTVRNKPVIHGPPDLLAVPQRLSSQTCGEID